MNIHINKHIDALMRYTAMAGKVEGLAGRELAQMIEDRREFADTYIADEYRALARPALMARFLNEVCKVPLSEARECTIAVLRGSSAFRLRSIMPAKDLALDVFVANGNIYAAVAVADMLYESAQGTAWETLWHDVLDVLRNRHVIE